MAEVKREAKTVRWRPLPDRFPDYSLQTTTDEKAMDTDRRDMGVFGKTGEAYQKEGYNYEITAVFVWTGEAGGADANIMFEHEYTGAGLSYIFTEIVPNPEAQQGFEERYVTQFGGEQYADEFIRNGADNYKRRLLKLGWQYVPFLATDNQVLQHLTVGLAGKAGRARWPSHFARNLANLMYTPDTRLTVLPRILLAPPASRSVVVKSEVSLHFIV